jgi:hypothetical protein
VNLAVQRSMLAACEGANFPDDTHVSASTMRVREAFSIVNFVLPSCPAIRPIESLSTKQSCATATIRQTDGARKVVSVQGFHILDLKRVQI